MRADLQTAAIEPEIVRTVHVTAILSPFSTYRIVREVASGRSVSDILVELGLPPDVPARIMLSNFGARFDDGLHLLLVAKEERERTIPRPGALLVVRVVPGYVAIPAILAIAASATAASTATAVGVSATTAALIAATASAVAGLVGTLIVRALVPPSTPQAAAVDSHPPSFSISGDSNIFGRYSVFPRIHGARQVKPQHASDPFVETSGNDQYLRQLFVFGYGPLDISQIKIGTTLITVYEDVQWEIRQGFLDDGPPTLYPGQVIDDSISVLLSSQSDSNIVYYGWNQQTTGDNCDEIGVELSAPSGLVQYNNKNGDHEIVSASIQIRYAPTGTTAWVYRQPTTMVGTSGDALRNGPRWDVPTGQYDVQVRVKKIVLSLANSNPFQDDIVWTDLLTIRRQSPFTMPGLALLALRIRATHQLQGEITNLNCVVSSILPDWDGASWTNRAGAWDYDFDNAGAGASSYGLNAATPHSPNARGPNNWINNEQGFAGSGAGPFTKTLANTPIEPGTVQLDTGMISLTDDGAGHLVAVESAGAWNGKPIYAQGKVVIWNGLLYASLANGNKNNQPDSTLGTWWQYAVTAGTVNYSSGAMSITLGSPVFAPNGAASFDVSYVQETFIADGGKALMITTASGSDGAAVASKNIPVHQDPLHQHVPNQNPTAIQFLVGGWYKASQAISHGIRLRVLFSYHENFAVGDIFKSIDVIADGAATTSWQHASATITCPTPPAAAIPVGGSFFVRVVCYHNPDSTGGVTVHWDDISVTHANGEARGVQYVSNPSFDFPGRITSNPASHYLDVLQGPANKQPLPAGRIDMSGIQAWHLWCDVNNRSNNMIADRQSTVFESLKAVCAMGRATFHMKDGLYSLLQDLVQSVPIQHFTPRNSWGFKSTRAFPQLPGMLKTRFVNPALNWAADERPVFDDGYSNATPNLLTEVLDLTQGCTDPAEAWRDARYHLAVARLRPETYVLNVDMENLVCTRGDLVLVSHDVIMSQVAWARVKQVTEDDSGNVLSITCDADFTFQPGLAYVARYRRSADGSSVLQDVVNHAAGGTWSGDTLTFQTPVPPPGFAADQRPSVRDLVIFGLFGQETIQLIVTKITPRPNLQAVLELADYAPAIQTADAGMPPPWLFGAQQADAVAAPNVIATATGDWVNHQHSDLSRHVRIKLHLSPPSDLAQVESGLERQRTVKPVALRMAMRPARLDGTTNAAAAWNSGTAYVVGDTVTYDGGVDLGGSDDIEIWYCLEANTNQPPGSYDGGGDEIANDPYWMRWFRDDPWEVSQHPHHAPFLSSDHVSNDRTYDHMLHYELSDGTFAGPTLITVEALGQLNGPADVSGLVANAISGWGIHLRWSKSTSPNIREYEVRQDVDGTFAGATPLANVRTTHFNRATPPGTYGYWVATIDTSGNYGANPPSVNVTLAGEDDMDVYSITHADSPWTAPTSSRVYVAADTTAGVIEIDLRAATGSGHELYVKNLNGTNAVNVKPHGADLLEGANAIYAVVGQNAARGFVDRSSAVWEAFT
jgi:hypothetical protein